MNSAIKLHVFALLLVLLRAGSALPQNTPPGDLDAYVARAMKTFDVPGLCVAVVKDGKTLLAKGHGVLDTQRPGLRQPAAWIGSAEQHVGDRVAAFLARVPDL